MWAAHADFIYTDVLMAARTCCVEDTFWSFVSRVENQLQSRAQETEVIGLATATLVSKYRKVATFDEFLARFFVIGKAAVAVLLFFVGTPHMVSYLILWTGVLPVHPVRSGRHSRYEQVLPFFVFG